MIGCLPSKMCSHWLKWALIRCSAGPQSISRNLCSGVRPNDQQGRRLTQVQSFFLVFSFFLELIDQFINGYPIDFILQLPIWVLRKPTLLHKVCMCVGTLTMNNSVIRVILSSNWFLANLRSNLECGDLIVTHIL